MFSITTPLHAPGNQFIDETYQTLLRQSEPWEWLILPNNGGIVPSHFSQDSRIKIINYSSNNIGDLKRKLSLSSNYDYIVELDADDLIADDCLSELKQAFESGADFVYSDTAEFKHPGWISRWEAYPYGKYYGWDTYPINYQGHDLIAMKSPPATPHNLRLIEWSPNHVRSWTKKSYLEVGGHNQDLQAGDDHELIVRYYLANKKFVHIPKCLYFYRVHESNTVKTHNSVIRKVTHQNYNQYITKLAEKFSDDNNLLKIDLCGGIDPYPGYTILDKNLPPNINGIKCDLNQKWILSDNSAGLIRANDAIEHLKDPINTFNEAYRVLAPGGFFLINVPSTNGLGAFCDPTHVSFYNRLSFRYYTSKQFARYIQPDFKGKFQLIKLEEYFPSEWHRKENVPYVEAHLVALKPGYDPMGEVLW